MNVQQYNDELKKAETVKQILEVVTKFYEVEKCIVKPITKAVFIAGINQAVKMVNCKERPGM